MTLGRPLEPGIMCVGDVHVRSTPPIHRIDDYVEALFNKLHWILGQAITNNCSHILFPGDLTDNPRISYRIVARLLGALNNPDFYESLIVLGQHDLRYHVAFENTPLNVLLHAGAIRILDAEPYVCENKSGWGRPIHFYGSSWDEDIPKIQDQNAINVLLIHRLFGLSEVWTGGEGEYINALDFIERNVWDLVVAGDNHKSFMVETTDNRYFVNCGSLMRSRIDQLLHEPRVHIYYPGSRSLGVKYVPIVDAAEVYDVVEVENALSRDERLQQFIEEVKAEARLEGIDFIKNLQRKMVGDHITPVMNQILQEVIRNAGSRIE